MSDTKAMAVGKTVYLVEFRDATGKLEWSETFDNLIPNAGLNKTLNDTFVAKSPDPIVACGLITGPGAAGVAAADTMASHSGWSEFIGYSNAARPTVSFGAVASQQTTNSASPCVFNINANGTVGGAFMCSGTSGGGAGNADQKNGTGGTIRSAGAFSSGDKPVTAGGTLTVTLTASLASA